MFANWATSTERRASCPPTTIKTKICTRCKKRRKIEQFYKDKHMKDGFSSWCKSCTRGYDREYAARKKNEAKTS